MPRHCADIYELGLQEEGIYKVTPSGGHKQPSVNVSSRTIAFTSDNSFTNQLYDSINYLYTDSYF